MDCSPSFPLGAITEIIGLPTANLGNVEFNRFLLPDQEIWKAAFYYLLRVTRAPMMFSHSFAFYNQKDKNFIQK